VVDRALDAGLPRPFADFRQGQTVRRSVNVCREFVVLVPAGSILFSEAIVADRRQQVQGGQQTATRNFTDKQAQEAHGAAEEEASAATWAEARPARTGSRPSSRR